MPLALIVDDQPDSALFVSDVFQRRGFSVDTASDVASARDALLRNMPDVALINLDLGDDESEREAFDLLDGAGLSNVMEVFLATPTPDYRSAARGMRLGASDYFALPDDVERLEETLRAIRDDVERATDEQDVDKTGRGLLIGESPPMQRLYRVLRKVAPTDATVLLAGESGSGKELVAQSLHALSTRADGPFVAMNCGAISQELVESELFGHVKGSFTGASRGHRGYFERASGGTLFLDEVTEMDVDLQVKLLRVLETNEYRQVGGEKTLVADARIVASTNRDPSKAVEQGALREDLYYRLAQFPMRVPPLRQRGDDIRLLAETFLATLNAEQHADKRFSPEFMDMLCLHDWPGNVRELKNAVTRAHILAGNEISTEDLPGKLASSAPDSGDFLHMRVGHTLEEVERRMILATLEHHEGNKKKAAAVLGISLKTLYNRLKKYRS